MYINIRLAFKRAKIAMTKVVKFTLTLSSVVNWNKNKIKDVA